jgi:hypothetical protein
MENWRNGLGPLGGRLPLSDRIKPLVDPPQQFRPHLADGPEQRIGPSFILAHGEEPIPGIRARISATEIVDPRLFQT